MSTSAYSLLRDEQHRAEMEELRELARIQTDASAYRWAIRKVLRELRELRENEQLQDAAEDLAEEAAELALDGELHSQFANSEYQHSEPAPADPEEPDPAILEWLEEGDDDDDDDEAEEPNPWTNEEERAAVVLALLDEEPRLEEAAIKAAFGELPSEERARLVARLYWLLCRLTSPTTAATTRATIERQSSPDNAPAELFRAVLEAAELLYPQRE